MTCFGVYLCTEGITGATDGAGASEDKRRDQKKPPGISVEY